MKILALTFPSLWNRKFTVLLTILSIALSVALLLGVEKIRTSARASFSSTISGTDLIIGARTGPVQLLLYSVFRIGNATNNMTWESYQDIASHKSVKWSVPLSLGDSHRGYAVLGTTSDYFEHYRYGRKQQLEFASGEPFDDLFHAVVGSEVASALGYQTGSEIVVAHGTGSVSFANHKDKPFVVSGVLERTGTPVDRTVHVSLNAIEAIHIGWESGAPQAGKQVSAEDARKMELHPEAITAFLVGVKNKIGIFQLQRAVNEYREEPLLAVLPGVALQELWSLIGVAEKALVAVSICVVLIGLVGMLTAILTSLNERRREIAILRSCGARPGHVFTLFIGEAVVVTVTGIALGIGLLYLVLLATQPIIESKFGLYVGISGLTPYDLTLLGIVFVAGALIGAVPAILAYRRSLADGLTLRI